MNQSMNQQPAACAVVQPITMRCAGPSGRQGELEVRFEYDPADPYAVWLRFGRGDQSIRWAICRELLSRGMTDPVGQGDVRLWPGADRFGRAAVLFEFHSPDGSLVAQAPTRDVYRFVTRTLASVPAGRESEHLDLDLLITDLLGSGSQAE